MNKGKASILYITHDRIGFSRLTLPHLLESGGYGDYSVTLVDNASTDGTREWLMSLTHPRIANITLNDDNTSLRDVTNRFWRENMDSEFIGKVDNDTLIPTGFVGQAVRALRNPVKLGPVGGMHFHPEDVAAVEASSYAHNLRRLPSGRRILVQQHLGGCCYVMRSGLLSQHGLMRDMGYLKGGWTEYQWKLTRAEYPASYLYPFMFAKHLDDPRFGLSAAVAGETHPEALQEIGPEKFATIERNSLGKLLGNASLKRFLTKHGG